MKVQLDKVVIGHTCSAFFDPSYLDDDGSLDIGSSDGSGNIVVRATRVEETASETVFHGVEVEAEGDYADRVARDAADTAFCFLFESVFHADYDADENDGEQYDDEE